MIRHLGYPCINMALSEEGVTSGRTCRLDRFSLAVASELALQNSIDLCKIIDWNVLNGVSYFRVGSDIFPFMDHPVVGYPLESLPGWRPIRDTLTEAGRKARAANMRLSCHPGPYCVLASDKPDVAAKAASCLQMHSVIGDLLGFGDDFKINIHVGTTIGGKALAAERFCANLGLLGDPVRRRLTVENDDRASMFSVADLVPAISARAGVPVCLDIHHHGFHPGGLTLQEAAALAFPTWGGCPEVHYSESRSPGKAAHSDLIAGPIPVLGDEPYDVMIEAKQKERALLRYRRLGQDWESGIRHEEGPAWDDQPGGLGQGPQGDRGRLLALPVAPGGELP